MSEKTMRNAEWLWRTAVLVGLGAMGFFMRDIYREQIAFNMRVESRISAIELKQAETVGNRFTSGDWVVAKGNIDTSLNQIDKRVTRNEDTLTSIKTSLADIDHKMDLVLERY